MPSQRKSWNAVSPPSPRLCPPGASRVRRAVFPADSFPPAARPPPFPIAMRSRVCPSQGSPFSQDSLSRDSSPPSSAVRFWHSQPTRYNTDLPMTEQKKSRGHTSRKFPRALGNGSPPLGTAGEISSQTTPDRHLCRGLTKRSTEPRCRLQPAHHLSPIHFLPLILFAGGFSVIIPYGTHAARTYPALSLERRPPARRPYAPAHLRAAIPPHGS